MGFSFIWVLYPEMLESATTARVLSLLPYTQSLIPYLL